MQTESDRFNKMLGMINDAETLLKKRDYARMNHLTRFAKRGKRTSFWLSAYLYQSIKELMDEIYAKGALLKDLDTMEDEEKTTKTFLLPLM